MECVIRGNICSGKCRFVEFSVRGTVLWGTVCGGTVRRGKAHLGKIRRETVRIPSKAIKLRISHTLPTYFTCL